MKSNEKEVKLTPRKYKGWETTLNNKLDNEEAMDMFLEIYDFLKVESWNNRKPEHTSH